MKRRTMIALIPALVLGALCMSLLDLSVQARSAQSGTKTVWDGVYSEAQATAGQALYTQECANCHGPTLNGGANQGAPPMKGEKFIEAWREDSAHSLYTKIKTTMPRRSERVMTEKETLELVAYTFRENGFPAGADLSLNAIGDVQIQRKEGPKPLPNNSLIQVVGCLTQEGDAWIVNTASAPSRVRTSEKSTPDELKAAMTRPLGAQTYRLQNLIMLGAFKPADHAGHKMMVKGLLSRRTAGETISVTEMEMLTPTCGK